MKSREVATLCIGCIDGVCHGGIREHGIGSIAWVNECINGLFLHKVPTVKGE